MNFKKAFSNQRGTFLYEKLYIVPFQNFLILPLAIFLIALFFIPIIQLFTMSFFEETFTVKFFKHIIDTPVYLKVIWNTIKLSFSVTLISIIIGYPVAYFLTILSNRARIIAMLFIILPFWTSLLVRIYAWMVILGRRGIINQFLIQMGLISEELSLLYNNFSVTVGMVHVLAPFFIFPLYSVLSRIDEDLLKASESLGAPKVKTFLKIYFPLSIPGVLAGSILVFIQAIGYFVTPTLLGGGRVIVISSLIEELVRWLLNWGLASALALILLLIVMSVLIIYMRLLKAEQIWG